MLVRREPLAPYLLWAKTREPAAIDLAGSNLWPCTLDDLPGARDAVDISAANDNGFAPLVDAIATHYGVPAARVVTAAGCSGANFLVAAACLSAGDDVLIEQPTYDPLIGACRLLGATVYRFARRADNGWRVDLDDVRARLTPRTRLIVLTTPHNPSGTLVDRDTLLELGRLASSVGAWVLSDEVYLDITRLAGSVHAASAATLDGPFLSTSSLTKSYGLAGLRSGWIVTTSDAMAERLRRTRDVIDNAGSAPADRLAAFAWTEIDALAARARAIVEPNVARARDFFAGHPSLDIAEDPRTTIVFPRLAGVADAAPFVERLRRDYGVAVAPGHFFDAPAHFRVSLGGDPARVAAGFEAIARALSRG